MRLEARLVVRDLEFLPMGWFNMDAQTILGLMMPIYVA
jgi:hypothetical protein